MQESAPYMVDSQPALDDLKLAEHPSVSGEKRFFAIAIGWNNTLKELVTEQNEDLPGKCAEH